MSKIKAVVLEKSGSRYTVLDQDGTFRQVHRRLNAEVGEEIQIPAWTDYFSGVRIWSGAVAMFLLVITSFLGWHMFQAPTVVALLSVDINPSLQLQMDNQGHFVAFETQNEAAKRLLNKLDFKGKPLEEVLGKIVSQAYDQKFLSNERPWVVVGYSPKTDKDLKQMPNALNEHQIISWVTEISEKKGLTPKVAVFSLTYHDRELAQQGDLTLGEYALWQTADKAGVKTQPEQLKDSSERVRLLEDPKVQVQIKAEKNESRSISISKPGENGTGKIKPAALMVPIKEIFPWTEKKSSKDGDRENDQRKDQDNENATVKANAYVNVNVHSNSSDKYNPNDNGDINADVNTKAEDEDIQKPTDQENYQKKDLNKPEDSERQETQRTRYNKVYVPQILNRGNLRHDKSHTYKIPEYNRDKQQKR